MIKKCEYDWCKEAIGEKKIFLEVTDSMMGSKEETSHMALKYILCYGLLKGTYVSSLWEKVGWKLSTERQSFHYYS